MQCLLIDSIQNIGQRDHMEDTVSMEENKFWKGYAIFDGHGGEQVSKFLASSSSGLLPFLLANIKSIKSYKKGALSVHLTELFVQYDFTVL